MIALLLSGHQALTCLNTPTFSVAYCTMWIKRFFTLYELNKIITLMTHITTLQESLYKMLIVRSMFIRCSTSRRLMNRPALSQILPLLYPHVFPNTDFHHYYNLDHINLSFLDLVSKDNCNKHLCEKGHYFFSLFYHFRTNYTNYFFIFMFTL